MTFSVQWMLLPNGIDRATGRARLSLVASPRAAAGVTKLGASDLMRWPEFVAGMGPVRVVEALTDEQVDARIESPPPDPLLWARLFAGGATAVVPFDKTDTPIFNPMETAYSFKGAAEAAEQLYADALRSGPTEALAAAHPVARRVAGLNAWAPDGAPDGTAGGAAAAVASPALAPDVTALMDPARLDSARLARASALLRERGAPDAAAMAPLAAVSRRLRALGTRGGGDGKAGDAAKAPPPSLVAKIRPLDEADFHQIVGLLLDHPALALRLGLRVDLTIPAFTGERVMRAIGPNGLPLNGPVPVAQPWSHTVCDPTRGLFVMKTQPDAPAGATEVVNGMLDLRPDPAQGKYVITDVDVVAAAEQLHVMASSLAQAEAAAKAAPDGAAPNGTPNGTPNGGTPAAPPATLPALRNNGLTVAQVDRRTKSVAHALARSARFDGPADEIEGAPVLFADDVTAGYRVDVSTDGGPFRSLMRRTVTYRVGADTKGGITTTDEGFIEPATAVEQRDSAGVPSLVMGEEVFSWDGWTPVARRPGPSVREDANGVGTEVVAPTSVPGLPLTMTIRPEPGSLPRLRFGRVYQFRVRVVDPAGNSVEPDRCDPAFVSAPRPYRRVERVGAPEVVPRRAYTPGESHTRLVVRTDGDGRPVGPDGKPSALPCERHVAPPAASQHLAELHGKFDEALGPDTPARAAARERLLAVGRRQDASLLDPTVPGPDGKPAPAQGITVARMDGASKEPLATLPLPRGASLPQGQYVHHDTDTLRIGYLTDPAADGAAFRGLPPTGPVPSKAPVTVPFGTQPWPNAEPFRFVAQAGAAAGTAVARAADGRPTLVVTVPPAAEVTTEVSATLTPDAVRVMDPGALAPADAARQGQVRLFSQSLPLTVVHAVRKPLAAPTLTVGAGGVERPDNGGTFVRVRGQVSAHRPSTSRVDIEASWTEIVDRGTGPVTFEPRRAVVGSVVLDTDPRAPAFDVRQQFGDTKRRRVTYEPAATTRFSDCFDPPEPGEERALQRLGAGVLVDVKSTRRPPRPKIHSTLPIFRWTREKRGDLYESVRRTAGVRLWLERPWMVTGEGEMLGVVVHASQQTGDDVAKSADADLFTRWGADPYEGLTGGPTFPHFLAAHVTNADSVHTPVALPDRATGFPNSAYAVAAVPVQFDAERELWYADVEIDPQLGLTGSNGQKWPFLRLAVVRFQAATATRFPIVPAANPSRVVYTDFVQLPPQCTLRAVRTGPGAVKIEQLVTQELPQRRAYAARWQRRLVEPLASPAPDLCADATEPGARVDLLPNPSPLAGVGGVLSVSAAGPALAELQAGRIVVEERLLGHLVEGPADASRVVYRDVFDYAVFDRPNGPV